MKKKTFILARLVLAMTLLASCGEEETKPSHKEYKKEPNTTYWEDVLTEETLTEETIIGW